jgi:VanZ family protein
MKVKRILYAGIYMVWIMVIFGFSIQSGTQSSFSSRWYVEILARFFASIDIPVSLSLLSVVVRKSAHFWEYAILGYISRSNVELNGNKLFYLSAAVPFIDEYLQTFIAGRNGNANDALIDLAGYGSGVLIAGLHTIRNKSK